MVTEILLMVTIVIICSKVTMVTEILLMVTIVIICSKVVPW